MAKDAKGHGSDARGVSRAPDFGARAVESPTANKPSGIFKPGTESRAAGMSDAQAAGALAQGHPKADVVATHPAMASSDGTIARWQSPGGKWAAELRAERGGYHLSSLKNGNPVGASWRPDIKDHASAIAHFDNHVQQSFDVKMKRVK